MSTTAWPWCPTASARATSLGTWIVTGNTTGTVVPVPDGGGSLYFDPDPTKLRHPRSSPLAAPTTSATRSSSPPGTDTLTGGGGGGNTFFVLSGSDLSAADTINGNSSSGNAIDFVSTARPHDTLTIGSNVTDIQNVNAGTFDANGNFIATPTPRR